MDRTIDILIVDDDPRNLDALEAILAERDYRLIRAGSADDALRALLKHDVAAIILDIYMPDMSGVELAMLIKSRKQFSEIPILLLTAQVGEEQLVLAGYGAGAVDYLTKPVKPEILRRKVAVFADLFRKTRELADLNESLEARVRERTAEVERSEAAMRLAARQKDEFLATLAHELRNPLAPLRMGIDLLLRREGLAEAKKTLSVMDRQLDHMVRLIDDLLDVARISGGKLELKKTHTNLAEAVRSAVETCRPFFEHRRQALSIELDDGIFAFADPTRVTQVVGNLLHNAVKFTPEGGAIRIELTREAGEARIRVVDEGVGLAPEQLGRVFDMFTRIDDAPAGSSGGLGIGLSLSRKLAELHEGRLTVESAGLGKGSTFVFSLPARAEPASTAAAAAAPAARKPAAAERGPPVTVVVIEDNLDSAEMLALWLRSRGYLVSKAHTGTAGLALIQEQKPHIVLCDLGLPELGGLQVCKSARELVTEHRPTMIALTGWGMKEDVRRSRDAGFDHHLVKPVAPDVLFELLERVREEA